MKLSEIQKKLKAPKNQFNKFGKYNYRNCEDILEAVKPLLGTSVLTISDKTNSVGGVSLNKEVGFVSTIPFVEATVTFIENPGDEKKERVYTTTAQAGIDVNRKGMDYAQSFGASSSYARKYALSGLFLIDDTKDPDFTNNNDGKEKPKLITEEQISEIVDLLNSIDDEEATKGFLKYMGVAKVTEIVQGNHGRAVKSLNAKIKQMNEDK